MNTQNNKIEKLKELGKNESAKRIQAEQRIKNLETIEAFNQGFDFCPVYFVLSDQTKNIKMNDMKSVQFLNNEGRKDSTISWKEKHIYTAYFGTINNSASKRKQVL